MKTRQIYLCATAALISLSAGVGGASAQTKSPPPQSVGVEEVIVTARRTAESLQTVPVSIVALSGADLERASVRSIVDLQEKVPNLIFTGSTTDSNTLVITLRGQRQNDVTPNLDASVAVYIDNVYYPRTTGLTNALIDISRIEVLRGPQGTLFGRNTTGGALTIYTANPTDRVEGNVAATYGNYNQVNLSGVVNIPISDNLAARFVARHGQRDGYGRDGRGRELDDENSYYFRGKLKAEIGKVEAVLSGTYSENKTNGGIYKMRALAPGTQASTLEAARELGLPLTPAGFAQANAYLNSFTVGDPYVTGATGPSKSDYDSHAVSLDLNAPLTEGISLRSTTGLTYVKRAVLQDGDGTPITVGNYDFKSRSRAYSQELVLAGGWPRLKWVLGAAAGVENAFETEIITNVPLVTATNPLQFSGKMRNANQGVFGQANWEILPKVRFTVGGRYSWDQRRLTADNRQANVCVVPAPGSVVTNLPSSPLNGPSQCPRTFEKSYGQPSWETVLDYQATETLYGYAKISYGYRAGGIGLRGGIFADTFRPFFPETVTNYEVGTKAQFFDRRAQINLAGFYDDYTNIQVTTAFVGPTGANIGITTNATKARVYGFEGDAVLRPTAELTVTGSIGLTDAKYTHFVDVTGDRSNTSFGLPRVTANVGASYLFTTAFGRVTPSIDYAYRSSLLLTPLPTTVPQYTQPAFGLLNGRIAVQVDAWGVEIAAFGRNLTDKVYTVSGLGTGGISTRIYGTRRTYGLTVTKRFGGD
ncbi:MAG: hypothetical protein JWQ29_1217 [Phenylobacterium sp.]|nr:hypothetical protein [Phenylobacterium sp.]